MYPITEKKKWNYKGKKWVLLLDSVAKKQLKNYYKLDIQQKEIIQKLLKNNKILYDDLEIINISQIKASRTLVH